MKVAKLVFLVGLVLSPWLASLYLHFWLEYNSEGTRIFPYGE